MIYQKNEMREVGEKGGMIYRLPSDDRRSGVVKNDDLVVMMMMMMVVVG